jgi:hypothetical protein
MKARNGMYEFLMGKLKWESGTRYLICRARMGSDFRVERKMDNAIIRANVSEMKTK